jgi:hypothetical protein
LAAAISNPPAAELYTYSNAAGERQAACQLELERGDRLQRNVDLEAEVHTLEENADAYEIERLTLL